MSDNKNDECGNVIEAPVGITPKTSRLLSPRSSNVEDAAIQKSVIQQQKKPDLNMNKSENTNTSDNKSKENVADQEEKDKDKDEKRFQTVVRPPTMRKRSYSFTDGSIKHPILPPVKRWKVGPGRGGGGRGRGTGLNSRLGAGLGPPGSKKRSSVKVFTRR